MLIFLMVLSCTALKLSGPVSLRDADGTEDNSSLAAWCKGTGCVTPFTPQSCLSWCDWNWDKQADAEARGVFAGKQWGKTMSEKAFGFQFAKSGEGAKCDPKVTQTLNFMDPTKDLLELAHASNWAKTYIPIFPGGDVEKKLGQTIMKCDHCYVLQSGTMSAAKDGIVLREMSIKFAAKAKNADQGTGPGKADGKASKMLIHAYDKASLCDTAVYSLDLDPWKGKANPAKNEEPAEACLMRTFFDKASLAAQKVDIGKCTTADNHHGNGLTLANTVATTTRAFNGDNTNAGKRTAMNNAITAFNTHLTACTAKVKATAGLTGFTSMGMGILQGFIWPVCI